MNIVVSGGTGFIGNALVPHLLQEHHSVILLTRDPRKNLVHHPHLRIEQWDGKTAGRWSSSFEEIDACINLTGELLAGKRWTKSQKEKIFSSRIDSTRAIVTAIESASKKPSVFINASGAGFYGDVPSGNVEESFPKGDGFLSDVCDKWELEALVAGRFGVRIITPRFGVVIGKNSIAMKKLMLPFSLFVGGHIGNGRQWFPWIHVEDVVGGIMFLLRTADISGPVNFAAPEAVTMKEFCRALGKSMHRHSWAPVPGVVLRSALGEMAEMLLTGQCMVPKKLIDSGYIFKYPLLQEALNNIVRNP